MDLGCHGVGNVGEGGFGGACEGVADEDDAKSGCCDEAWSTSASEDFET